MSHFVLIDGNSIANRAFYALPLLSTSTGLHTNAVLGFTTMLLKVIEEMKPTHIMVAFDAGKVVFRHSEYADYKGGRAKTPPELSEQFPLIRELLDAFSIQRFELEGYEADDIIGTLTKRADEQAWKTTVITGDKDMLQLVSEHVSVALTRKGVSEIELYTPQEIQDKYGLAPLQIIDLKGLMGDTSDNIPGVPGVGEKTALKLLHEYGSVEEVLANVDRVSGKKLQENLRENVDKAKMSKELATILREAPVELNVQETGYDGYDGALLSEFFKRMEFKSLLSKIKVDAPVEGEGQAANAAPFHFEVVTEESAAKFAEKLTSPMAFYVEMDGDNYHHAPIIGFGLSADDVNLYVPWDQAKEWKAFSQWLEDSTKEKWTFDGKRDTVGLAWHDQDIKGIGFDVYLASYLLNATESNPTLDSIASQYAQVRVRSDDEVYGKGAKRLLPEEDVISEHVAHKAAAIWQSVPVLREQLAENKMNELLNDLEAPLSMVLALMEKQGIKVNRDRLAQMGVDLDAKLEGLTKQIYELAGQTFNINSPKQLGEILFDVLDLPVLKKTKTGPSTSADVLEKLSPYHPIIDAILTFRQLGKLRSTYIEGLTKEIHSKSSKVHTLYNQATTATGRLSSTEPNLQNIPIRMEEGRKIREAFIPSEEGWYMLAADYSQIELRILAHISGDENLIDAFQKGMDIHTRTAMDVFGVEEGEVTSLMRRQAKAVNFGIVYGISDYGLSQNLNITRKEAGDFIERYFSVFSGVKLWMEEIVKQAKQDGFVTTLLNRRRYLPDIRSSNFNLRSFAERTAMNTPIQGTAADVIKLAMIRMQDSLQEKGLKSRMLLQVHDELVFEVPQDELEMMKQLVPEVMESALKLDVPLKVDVSFGHTWYEAK
ncbi:DNA polymerase I [Brevibacillus centrosporus]|uniref:DNA polymerase I n=1 Tax=Brevibacillus centrosporus TaxID=54910 RepID=A0A1I3L6P5_9BACL|nr:DNA polymerase I [Brevibacillus centrosporus]MEC2130153.1 DNA polymerase I [Brevibacillus centrosporus]RNB66239.1 DNA polymerase I [Brevibacillus centrosporus]GED34571.1 DNA polymerase [Brevibacillus centrosporus]SFI80338.1 DNA polymerase I [Brevibacillus centrosporus]